MAITTKPNSTSQFAKMPKRMVYLRVKREWHHKQGQHDICHTKAENDFVCAVVVQVLVRYDQCDEKYVSDEHKK